MEKKCYYCGHDANTSGLCDPCDHQANGRITGLAPIELRKNESLKEERKEKSLK